jgi:hypothetical protein
MKRRSARAAVSPIDPLRARHLKLAEASVSQDGAIARVMIDQGESPLAWLARRKGRDGQALIPSEQFIAGERLRADFTRGHMTPRVTSSWTTPISGGRSRGAAEMTDIVLAARQRVRAAMEACGPEFSGLLLDVCCFLRGLEDIERERGWPQRSAKVVLQLALARLARHYGLAAELRGQGGKLRSWAAD